jgi:hypothetical protein
MMLAIGRLTVRLRFVLSMLNAVTIPTVL